MADAAASVVKTTDVSSLSKLNLPKTSAFSGGFAGITGGVPGKFGMPDQGAASKIGGPDTGGGVGNMNVGDAGGANKFGGANAGGGANFNSKVAGSADDADGAITTKQPSPSELIFGPKRPLNTGDTNVAPAAGKADAPKFEAETKGAPIYNTNIKTGATGAADDVAEGGAKSKSKGGMLNSTTAKWLVGGGVIAALSVLFGDMADKRRGNNNDDDGGDGSGGGGGGGGSGGGGIFDNLFGSGDGCSTFPANPLACAADTVHSGVSGLFDALNLGGFGDWLAAPCTVCAFCILSVLCFACCGFSLMCAVQAMMKPPPPPE